MTSSPTEHRNPASTDLDLLGTADVLRVINEADATVPGAVAAALGPLAAAVDLAVAAVRSGGRVHYFGAGSSGRYGALDAAEIPPTYGVTSFVAHLAGGPEALVRAVENVEDDEQAGRDDAAGVAAGDVVVGLAASGRTPYVRGALLAARRQTAATVLISCHPDAPLAPCADVHVLLDTGPEVVTGSTRMKAGTAQKMALHSFSTAVLVRLGHTYSNLMIDVAPNNAKLRARQIAILEAATGASAAQCRDALAEADGELRVALVAVLAQVTAVEARARLAAAGDDVRAALR